MKPFLKIALKYYLKILAKLALALHRPVIIAIAGSTNKTIIKDRITEELNAIGREVRADSKSYNTEIGLPVAILSLPSGYGSYGAWLSIILKAPLAIFQKNFPKILVLELGVSKPGDMKYLLSIIKPRVAILSDITQRYVGSFSNMDDLVREFQYLFNHLKRGATAVLNSDNSRIQEISKNLKNKKITFGFGEAADYRVISRESVLARQKIKVSARGKEKEYEISRPGEHQVYALLAGIITLEIV